ncbi:hypothetical protein LSAT2_024550, partial [Lamellibrachia satsuma]
MTQASGSRFSALPQNGDNTVSGEVAIAEAVQTAIAETKSVQTRSTGSNCQR